MKNFPTNKYDLGGSFYVPKSPLEIRLNDEPRHKSTFSFNFNQNKKLNDYHDIIHKRQIEKPLIIERKPKSKKVTIGNLLSPNNPYIDDSDLEYSDEEDSKERKIAKLFKKNDLSQSISSLLSDSGIEPLKNNEEENKYEVDDLKKQVERIKDEEKRKEILRQNEKENSFVSPIKNIFTQKDKNTNTNVKPSEEMTYQCTSPLKKKLEGTKKEIFSSNIKYSSENKPSILPSQKLQERINYTSFNYQKNDLHKSNTFIKSIDKKRSIFPSNDPTQENRINSLTHEFKSFFEHNANIERKIKLEKSLHKIKEPINFSKSINLFENSKNFEEITNLKEYNKNMRNCARIKLGENRNISFAD